MATAVPARLSASEGRKFGLTVGIAFLVITGILVWRDHMRVVPYLGALGGLLVVAGLVVPTRLGPIERAWMGLAHLISKVTTPIFMGIVYFVVLSPIGVLMRLLGRNPMRHPLNDGGYWVSRASEQTQPGGMERQF